MSEQVYLSDLFINLAKYAPRPNITPLENFITEAFAYMLRSCQPLRSAFLEEFCGINDFADEWSISTQKMLPNGLRPDLFISYGGHFVYIESKVWSELNFYESLSEDTDEPNNQVKQYVLSIPVDELDKTQVLLITSRPVFHLQVCQNGSLTFDPNRDYLRWSQIYKLFSKQRDVCDNKGILLIDNFCALLEEHEMAPLKGMGEEWRQIMESYEAVKQAADGLRDRLKNRVYSVLDEVIRESGYSPKSHFVGDGYVSAKIMLGKKVVWICLYYSREKFLQLMFWVEEKYYRTVNPLELTRIQKKPGYQLYPNDSYIFKTFQLQELSGEEGASEQVREGSEFLREEIILWQKLFDEQKS